MPSMWIANKAKMRVLFKVVLENYFHEINSVFLVQVFVAQVFVIIPFLPIMVNNGTLGYSDLSRIL